MTAREKGARSKMCSASDRDGHFGVGGWYVQRPRGMPMAKRRQFTPKKKIDILTCSAAGRSSRSSTGPCCGTRALGAPVNTPRRQRPGKHAWHQVPGRCCPEEPAARPALERLCHGADPPANLAAALPRDPRTVRNVSESDHPCCNALPLRAHGGVVEPDRRNGGEWRERA